MKRQKRKGKRPGKSSRPASAPASAPTTAPAASAGGEDAPSRRDFLRKVRNGGIALAVVGGGSWYLVDTVRASMREHDLSRIGNGVPTVVQIHDPQCPQCVALQRETRDALCEFDGGQLQYVIANIRSPEGRQLATTHRVGHVTLLLFDPAGERRATLSGPKDADYLVAAFRRHVTRYGNTS